MLPEWYRDRMKMGLKAGEVCLAVLNGGLIEYPTPEEVKEMTQTPLETFE